MSNQNGRGLKIFVIFILILGFIASMLVGAFLRGEISAETMTMICLITGGIIVLIVSIVIMVKVHQYKKRKEQERLRAEQERELKNAEEVRKKLTAPYRQTENNQKDIDKCQVSAAYFSCDLQTRYMEAMEDAWMTHVGLLEAVKKTNMG